MDTLTQLVGKQIQRIERLEKIEIGDTSYTDDILKITFTDASTWVLASWDGEGFCSGIAMLVNEQRVHTS